MERISNQWLLQKQMAAQQYQAQQNGAFGTMLHQELRNASPPTAQPLAFSKHAISRAQERGIEITPHLMDQIRGGMIRAQAKGATNILAMDSEKAFIINVPNAKVITAITQDEMKNNVFTNIDGAVFL